MVAFPPFDVEVYMDGHETSAVYNIAETCADSISVAHLLELSGQTPETLAASALFRDKLTYGHIKGSPGLRRGVASTYASAAGITEDDVVITQGAIAANFLVLLSLCKDGDHVVVVDPTYQQLHEAPVAFGATLSKWEIKQSEGWLLNLDVLKTLLTPQTSLLILNNPNNPTGQLIPTQTLLSIIDLVKKHAAPECVIMCDEVYRPLFHDDVEEIPASILELGYPHAVATGSLSKAYSLAGLRVGWLASNDRKITDAAYLRRDYNIISVATIDDHLASLALSPTTRSKIVNRNVALTSTNRRLVEAWVAAQEGRITWVAPNAGTTAILHLGEGVDDETFCERLQQETGVMLVPGGRSFDLPGTVRIGYVSSTATLEHALNLLGPFLERFLAGNKNIKS